MIINTAWSQILECEYILGYFGSQLTEPILGFGMSFTPLTIYFNQVSSAPSRVLLRQCYYLSLD